MSVTKLGSILFSSFLIFATAPLAPAQQTDTKTQETTKKQTTTTKKGTAGKDQSTTAKSKTDQSTSDQSTSATTDKTKSQKSKTTTKKGTADKEKKTSSISRDKVRETQSALMREGFNPGPIDGVMGPMTMTALRNYQSHNHLEETGTLNAETENVLLNGATASTSQSGTQSRFGSQQDFSKNQTDRSQDLSQNQPYRSDEYKHKDLSQNQDRSSDLSQNQPNQDQSFRNDSLGNTQGNLGDTSQNNVTDMHDVKKIQQDLDDLGYSPGDINGMMSSNTQEAIRQFQWWNSLPVTGNLDEQTKSAIETQEQGGTQSAQLDRSAVENPVREKPAVPSESPQTYKQDSTTSSSHAVTTTQDTKADHHHGDKDKSAHSGKKEKDAEERISKSATVLQDLTSASDRRVPNEILERAEAIAVIPNMLKGAFGIGGRYGKGVVAERTANGSWSAPAFIEIGGGSFGAQLGVTSTDLVLVFTDRKAMNMLENGKDLKLGVDAGVAAGPLGREAEAGVNANLSSAIYAYSRAKGLFAGIALDGAVLNMDKSMNERVYGSSIDSKQLLNGRTAMNSTVQPFVDALDKVVPRKRISQK